MEESKEDSTVEIHYQKNPLFRQVHVDGAFGGITPKGMVNINFYGERLVIPKSEIFSLTQEGYLKDVVGVGSDSKKGAMRELEFGIYMDIKAAKHLHKWLELRIAQFEQQNKKTKK